MAMRYLLASLTIMFCISMAIWMGSDGTMLAGESGFTKYINDKFNNDGEGLFENIMNGLGSSDFASASIVGVIAGITGGIEFAVAGFLLSLVIGYFLSPLAMINSLSYLPNYVIFSIWGFIGILFMIAIIAFISGRS